MIKAKDAIATARSLIGTPYSELDCINLIKKVIRTAPGGVPDYTTAGTNSLWDSRNASAKYRDLTTYQEGIDGAKPGMLAFKRRGDDVHHVGLLTDQGTVIHSSGPTGRYQQVVETDLDDSWHLLAIHRYIDVDYDAKEEEETSMESYKATVVLNDPGSTLNVRNAPSTAGRILNKLHHGDTVIVQAAPLGGWAYITYGGHMGYVHTDYLERVQEPDPEVIEDVGETGEHGVTVLISSDGQRIELVGDWRVAQD